MKYIDADILRKEIDKWTDAMSNGIEDDYSDGVRFALNHFVFVLESLQQEQNSLPDNLDEAALQWLDSVKFYSDLSGTPINAFKAGAGFAVQRIISLIESRIAEILGDGQPAPILRIELQELIDKIKEESK